MKALLKTYDIFTIGKSNTMYIVTHTEFTGGGTGHGPHDVYPNGHYVTARKIQRNLELGSVRKFYQSGCFGNLHFPFPCIKIYLLF
jgi:hypothetical protein